MSYVVNSELYKRSLWLNKNIDFLFGMDIVEYDMHSAGLSLIKEFKLLPEEDIQVLDKMDKKSKNVKIGLYQKDKKFAKKLLECFVEARKRFITSNKLTEENVLSVKKDAIFVIDTPINNTDFGEIHFSRKNSYTSYLRLNRLEFYINTSTNIIDIKGLGQGEELEKVHELHDDYMLKFIMKFTKLRENMADKKVMTNYISNFCKKYRERKLPIGFYRELGKGNCYELFDDVMGEVISITDTSDIDNLIITSNYFNYIIPLASLYF